MLPPPADAAAVCPMGDVPAVYPRDYAPPRPLVCLEETGKQLVAEARVPLPAAAGPPARVDDEYERKGAANLSLVTAPRVGQRRVAVTERRTAEGFAAVIRGLVDKQYPEAEKVVRVLDDRNTHRPASLSEAFAPAEARRLVEALGVPSTPKQGSWLSGAEMGWSTRGRQCLGRGIASREKLAKEVGAWPGKRKRTCGTVDGQFTTKNARTKLERLYPSVQDG